MTGTNASFAASGGSGFPAPRLRLRSLPAGPVPLDLFDGTGANVDAPVAVVLAGVPDTLFDSSLEAEIRLFRYGRCKSASSRRPVGARWAALPHIEGGGNAYAASGWLGSYPASGGTDRFSRVLLAGRSHGDVVDVTPLLAYWLRLATVRAIDAGGNDFSQQALMSTWAHQRFTPSSVFGLSRNVEPVRFAVGFVGRNASNGKWDLLSPLSRFLISNAAHPFEFDPAGTQTLGRRVFKPNPAFDPKALSTRLSNSEWLAGR